MGSRGNVAGGAVGWRSLVIGVLAAGLAGEGAMAQTWQGGVLAGTSRLAEVVPGQPADLATLADGLYQWCSQPAPAKLDGAGVCLVFRKSGSLIEGYYGYPHSDRFICLRGTAKHDRIQGQALVLSWPGEEWPTIPKGSFQWDEEGHLTLAEGRVLRQSGNGGERLTWIQFGKASLTLSGFYAYRQPRMRPASELCDFSQLVAKPAQ